MLTRQGWASLAMAVIAIAIGRLFGVLELFVLGAGVITLVLACLVWVRLRQISLNVVRRVTTSRIAGWSNWAGRAADS